MLRKKLLPVILTLGLIMGMGSTLWAQDDSVVLYFNLDEGEGKEVQDASGNNNGELVGNPQWVDGKYGKALLLNGSSDYVKIPDSPSLHIKDKITVMAWVKPENVSHWGGIVAKSDDAANHDYPEVSFYLAIEDFNSQKWESAHGKVPLHFLSCPLSGAPIFHGGGGWSIATPVIDRYPMLGISAEKRKIASEWSENWIYAPSIAAHAVPVAGLWNPDSSFYFGYAFYGSRLNGEVPPKVGIAYCWLAPHLSTVLQCGVGGRRLKEFITLTLPYANPHRKLCYPQKGDTFNGHFSLIYSTNLPCDAAPNAFCNEFAWRRYVSLMPSVPDYNDLSWLPTPYRVQEFHHPSFSRLLGLHAGNVFIKKGSLLPHGTSWLWPLDYFYEKQEKKVIDMLHEDLTQLVRYAQHFKVNEDSCVYWQWPIKGDWQDSWGKGIPTLHNIHGTLCALAFLDAYRNERDSNYLPYIDGALRWLKHILYTRNCYADVPDGMFAWDAAPLVSFCLKYGDTFRKDEKRKELVALADRLVRSLAYRCLAMYNSDNDPTDNIDSSWMMGGNAGEFWVGIGSANELWELTAGIMLAYVATGDPILGGYVRGILSRWHWLFRDAPKKSVLDWGNEFAEIWAVCDSVPNFEKNQRSRFGGLWGGLEQLIYPPYKASVRVVCRQKAALAFNVNGVHTKIMDYRADEDANFSFKVVGSPSSQDGHFDLVVTWPFWDIRTKQVTVNGQLVEPRCFEDRPDTLLIPDLSSGAVVQVGDLPFSAPILPSALAKKRNVWSSISVAGFSPIDISGVANEVLNMNWLDSSSWASYEGGLKWILGVPFVLIEPGFEKHPVAASGEIAIPKKISGKHLFALVGGVKKGARLTLRKDDGTLLSIELKKAVTALEAWPPCFKWRIALVSASLPVGKKVEKVKADGCLLFAITVAKKETSLSSVFSAIEQQRKIDKTAEAKKKTSERIARRMKKIGKAAILPLPEGHDNTPPPLFFTAFEQNVLSFISPKELVNPQIFNPQNYPILFVFGDESYIQTVHEQGDGDRAIIQYLKGGGTIVALPNGPTPFAYNEKGELITSYDRFGFTLCGQGGSRKPVHPEMYTPWEHPPSGERFVFKRNPKQDILVHIPDEFPFYSSGDLRWRPMGNFWSKEEAEYIPLVTLYDGNGRSRGDGAAIVQFTRGTLEKGRIVYVWMRLWSDIRFGDSLIEDIIKEVTK